MATELEYAELSNRVYNRTQRNRTPVPEGWTELRWLPDPAYSGFSAGVYQKGGEIVISFTGTNQGKAVDFLEANIPLGLGATSLQVYQAMQLYFETKAQHPDAVISFTGHSLGGGLASMMAVFFDKDATIFDAAPFELGARNPAALALTLATMTALGYTDPAFSAYVATAGLEFPARELRVNAVSLESEILAGLRIVAPTIYGGVEKVVPIGTQTLLDATGTQYLAARTQLHSMTLLVAMLRSNAFAAAVQGRSQSLELFFDNMLYQRDPETSNQANFLDRLLLADMGNASAGTAGQPILDRFAADLLRIDASAGMTGQASMQKALTVAAMEYYYFNDPAAATQLFTVADGGLHFNYADIGQPQFGLKSPRLLAAAMQPFLSPEEWAAVGYKLDTQDAWHVQSGAAGMFWAAGGATAYDAAIGGAGVDVLDGGAGDDILIGGAGQDFLNGGADRDVLIGGLDVDVLEGGAGSDRLLGGAGIDVYRFSGSFGSDSIEDSGGDGAIELTGVGELTGANARKTSPTATTWQTDDKQVTYSLVQVSATQQNLVITVASAANSGTITIRNWVDGQLGISLGTEVQAPQTTTTYTGDFAKATSGGTYSVSNGNYAGSGAQADAQDVINGAASADHLQGLGGNDGLAGGAGDDLIEGGAGDDLLLGGAGADVINGGAGNDFIFGSGLGLIDSPSNVNFTPPVASGAEYARGFSWVLFDGGIDINGFATVRVAGANPATVASGDGVIELAGVGNLSGAGAKKTSPTATAWQTDDKEVTYSLVQVNATQQNLVITLAPAAHNGTITIRNWVDGQLGISLGAEVRVPQTTATYTGGTDRAGEDRLFGSTGADLMQGLDGNDLVAGGAGDDNLDGGLGDDLLVGGLGADTIQGGAGSDWIFGSGQGTVGDLRDPAPVPGGATVLTRGNGWVVYTNVNGVPLIGEVAVNPLGGDAGKVIDGGAGNDNIDAGTGADVVHGGGDDGSSVGRAVCNGRRPARTQWRRAVNESRRRAAV